MSCKKIFISIIYLCLFVQMQSQMKITIEDEIYSSLQGFKHRVDLYNTQCNIFKNQVNTTYDQLNTSEKGIQVLPKSYERKIIVPASRLIQSYSADLSVIDAYGTAAYSVAKVCSGIIKLFLKSKGVKDFNLEGVKKYGILLAPPIPHYEVSNHCIKLYQEHMMGI